MALSKIDAANFLTGTIPQGNVANASLNAVTALPAAITTGKIINAYHTQTESGSASNNAWSLQSNLTTNVTPASSSSKFLLMVGVQTKIEHGEAMGVRLDRDSTTILVNSTYLNDLYYSAGSGEVNLWSIKNFIDSPSTTSAIDYKVYCYTSGGTVQIPNTTKNYLTILELSS